VLALGQEGGSTRWLLASTAETYPALLRQGVRLDRVHDLELTEALLLAYAGRWGEPRGVPAALARLRGEAVPDDPPARAANPPGETQGELFDLDPPAAVTDEDLLAVYRSQQARIAETEEPGRFRMLVAAESASALVAAEMGHVGLPWRPDIHDRLLREMLGPPSPLGGPPQRLVDLTAAINDAFGQRLHPESPAEVVRAFRRVGIEVPSSRAWVLREVDHPAVPLLLEFKELYRIWTANGWSWLDSWVHDGRFKPEYIPAGVVSGRWATRGGGALQIPKVLRQAVVADPGWKLVVADAGQLEPRILAAMAGDARMQAAAGAGDMYAALAAEAFGGDRALAKVALLGAMYGQTGGQAIPALAALRGSYPTAMALVEGAARTGENGGLVRTWLGRTCPAASSGFMGEYDEQRAGARARARGRFTRNFVIQGTAAEWAACLLATLRTELAATPAELVFFQHDEVIVHCPRATASAVVDAFAQAGAQARLLLFGDTPVRFPLDARVVDCYADAK
jgi:DNA polymerase-1